MAITDQMIDQAYLECHGKCGGVRNDYYGLLYLEQEFKVERDRAVNQLAFGGNDYGLDGFHFDREARNLYLLQFKHSKSPQQFAGSMKRLIDAGMERVFCAPNQDRHANQMLMQLWACLRENRDLVNRVLFRFVFDGDPTEADHSQILAKLQEDLEAKYYLLEQFFGHRDEPVTMIVEFRSPARVGRPHEPPRPHIYELEWDRPLVCPGPHGECMYVGLIRLRDLDAMYSDMGQRFLDHNIRGALPEDKAVSRALEGAFRRIVIDGQDAPAILPFNHNGISLKAERLELDDGHLTVIEPRLLNGAQTVAAYHRFLAKGEANPALRAKAGVVDQLRVLCKIVTGATREFVTTVTVNNNRQNPVAAWNLRANDEIQLQLADRFRDELQPGIYYERQQKAFDALTTEELEEQGIAPGKAVELLPLAKTFLVSDGRIGWLSSISRIFEDDKQYYEVFCPARLEADVRRILLCYKIGYRLSKLVGGIADEWPARYDYVRRSRNLVWALLCQGVLNDPKVSRYAEWYGNDLVMQADYTDCLVGIAKKRCRPVLSALAGSGSHKAELAEGNFKFLLTDTAFKECMGIAYDRWGWALSRLR